MWKEFRGLSFHRINLRIMQTELKMVICTGIVDEVSFNEESRTILTLHIETSPSKREQEIQNTLNRQEKISK